MAKKIYEDAKRSADVTQNWWQSSVETPSHVCAFSIRSDSAKRQSAQRVVVEHHAVLSLKNALAAFLLESPSWAIYLQKASSPH